MIFVNAKNIFCMPAQIFILQIVPVDEKSAVRCGYKETLINTKYRRISQKQSHPAVFCSRKRELISGSSPPRLHYDRAANYGSIISPVCCHRRAGSSPALFAKFIARQYGSWRFCRNGSCFRNTDRNVPDEVHIRLSRSIRGINHSAARDFI